MRSSFDFFDSKFLKIFGESQVWMFSQGMV